MMWKVQATSLAYFYSSFQVRGNHISCLLAKFAGFSISCSAES